MRTSALLLLVLLAACSSKPAEDAPDPERTREVEALIAEGSQLVAAGKYREAADRFKSAVVADPKNLRAQYDLAVALDDAQDWKGAAEAYERVLQLSPRLALARHHLGEVRLAQGDLPAARRELEAATALDARYGPSWIDLAGIDVAEGHPADAVTRLEKATRTADEPDVWYQLGLASELAGDPKQARAAYEKAIKMEPAHALALNNLALLEAAERRPDEAVGLLLRAVQANPAFPEAEKNLGIVLYKTKGQGYLALSHLKSYVDQGGKDTKVLAWIAEIREASRTYRTDDRAFAVLDRIENGKVMTADSSFPLRDAAVGEKAKGLKKGDRVRLFFESPTGQRVVEVQPAK